MTFFPKIKTESADSPSVDAVGRFRVSTPRTLFDSKQIVDDRQIYWSTKFLNAGTSSYSSNKASTTLIASATTGSLALRQSKIRANYQSGKSLLTNMSFVFGESDPGMRKRVGLFDDNNGIYFELSGSSKNLVIRSNVTGAPVNQVITQSLWNLDKYDGTGPSAHVLDVSKSQIFHTDLEWLGVGRARMGFNVSGSLVYAHEFINTNISSSVYMSTPNLPIRYEIENISSNVSGTVDQICSTISSEGGFEVFDITRTADRAVTVMSGVTNVALFPIVSIRLKSNYVGSTVRPVHCQLLCTSNATYRWALVMNPRVGPVDNAVWVPLLSSSVEYDVSRTSVNALTGGLIITSGYASMTSDFAERQLATSFVLGTNIDDTSDEIVLAAQVVGGTTETFLGSLTFQEFI